MKLNIKIRSIVYAGILAAIYAGLTILLSFMSYGPIQFRIAEALTVLPYFSPFAIAGLTIGCLLSSLIASPYAWMDILFGSLATFLGATITWLLSKKKNIITFWLAPLPTVLSNMFIVGAVLTAYSVLSGQINQSGLLIAYLYNISTIGLGEIVCCYGLGIPVMYFVKNNRKYLPF